MCHARTHIKNNAIHLKSLGLLKAIKSIANVKSVSFITAKNSGETSIAHAIIGFASLTPFETAYNVKAASAKLHN